MPGSVGSGTPYIYIYIYIYTHIYIGLYIFMYTGNSFTGGKAAGTWKYVLTFVNCRSYVVLNTSLRSRSYLLTLINKDFVPWGKMSVSHVFFGRWIQIRCQNFSIPHTFRSRLKGWNLLLQVKGLESSAPGHEAGAELQGLSTWRPAGITTAAATTTNTSGRCTGSVYNRILRSCSNAIFPN